jgi:hypothetical protein
MKKILGLVAGVALAGMVSSASATTVTLDYLGRGDGLLGEVTVTPDALPDGTQTNLLAGSLRMQRGQMGFLAWCFQFARQIEKTANYMINPNALDSRRRDDLSRLATVFLGRNTGDNADSAAFQLAIWEIVEETDTDDATGSILYDLAGGDFQAMATNNDNVVDHCEQVARFAGRHTRRRPDHVPDLGCQPGHPDHRAHPASGQYPAAGCRDRCTRGRASPRQTGRRGLSRQHGVVHSLDRQLHGPGDRVGFRGRIRWPCTRGRPGHRQQIVRASQPYPAHALRGRESGKSKASQGVAGRSGEKPCADRGKAISTVAMC